MSKCSVHILLYFDITFGMLASVHYSYKECSLILLLSCIITIVSFCLHKAPLEKWLLQIKIYAIDSLCNKDD